MTEGAAYFDSSRRVAMPLVEHNHEENGVVRKCFLGERQD